MATSFTTIFLDLDDVLADFTGDALRHFGCTYNSAKDYPNADRDVCKALEHLTGVSLPPSVFWDHFKREWWANLTPTPWCHDLIDYCAEKVGTENVVILTATTKCGDCLAGKLDWIEENTPKWMHRQYIMTPRKHFCAKPGALLIDDCDENCDRFMLDDKGVATGATAFRWPQPWNKFCGQLGNELNFLKWVLKEIPTSELTKRFAQSRVNVDKGARH